MALPILPLLLLIGGGAFVLANAGKKKSSGKSGAVGSSQCKALEKLNELGPGVWPGALTAVRPEIEAIPPDQRRQSADVTINYSFQSGESGSESIAPFPLAVYTVAQRAYERLCRESAPQVKFERWTLEGFVQELRNEYGEEPFIGSTVPEDLVSQFLSGERKVIVQGLRIEDPSKTLDQKEAFAWLLQAAAMEMFNEAWVEGPDPLLQVNAPKLDYNALDAYFRENSQALYNPTLAWGDDLSYLGKPNKNFDFGMFQYLENQLEFYLGPGGISFAEPYGVAENIILAITMKYLRDVIGINTSEIPIPLFETFAMQWEAATTMPDYCITPYCAATGFTAYNVAVNGEPVYFVRGDDFIKRAGRNIGVPLLESGLTQSLDIAARVALLGAKSAFFTSAAEEWLANDIPAAPLQFVYMQPGPARDQAEAAFEASSPYIYELWLRVRSDIDDAMQTGMGLGN